MHLNPPNGAAVKTKEIVQRIKTIVKETNNLRPSKILQQGMENIQN